MTRGISRRRALKLATAASALPLVHIRSAGAAGKLTCAFWDHWVPAGNDAMRKVVAAWADKNKVDVQLDFLTAIGNKIDLTMGAEAVAKTGHDIFAFDIWTVHQWSDELTPVDDVMSSLIDKYGPVAQANEYLAKINGHWMAVPTGSGSAPLTPCARISMLKQYAGIDVQAWYPAHEVSPPEAEDWTYDTQLKAAEACAKAGHAFGFGCGTTTNSVQTWGAMFGAFGADLVDGKGNITVDSDNVRQVLEYAKKMLPFLPPDTVSYDDASNNRALISGKAAMIYNPPSAWAVAKRDAPQVAEDCWTFPNPKGVKGRLVPHRPYFWGIWTFAKNQSAAKDLLQYLMERPRSKRWIPRPSATTSRHSCRCRTSRSGRRWNRRKGPCSTTRCGRGTRRSTTSPARPPHPTSRCRCGTAAPFRRWWRSYILATRSTRPSPGRSRSWKGSFAETNHAAGEERPDLTIAAARARHRFMPASLSAVAGEATPACRTVISPAGLPGRRVRPRKQGRTRVVCRTG